MSEFTWSAQMRRELTHIFVADFRPAQDRTALVGQLAVWRGSDRGPHAWFAARVDITEFTRDAVRAGLLVMVSHLKQIAIDSGQPDHPICELQEVPDSAIDLAMREDLVRFVTHDLGWGHIASDTCRFCA